MVTQPQQPVPMLDNPFSKKNPPGVQPEPSVAQLEAMPSCPVADFLGEANSHPATPS